jgi:outer membrane protein assembly factor BamE (lipoprotein component of BamABCDE complex)
MKPKAVGLFIVALLVFLAGCAGLMVAKYDRIEMGMTKEEVTEILGEPWVKAPKIYVYQGKDLEMATILFNEEGRVVEKKWDDGKYER